MRPVLAERGFALPVLRLQFIAGTALLCFVAIASAASVRAPVETAPIYEFTFNNVLAEARRRAATTYVPPRSTMPAWLQRLSPDQYRGIRFNTDDDVWRNDDLPFRLDLLPLGFNFQTPVAVSVLERGQFVDLNATADMFLFGPGVSPPPPKSPLPLSGFRIRSRINSIKVWDEFLVFQGASYFRAVAENEVYGLSGRGLALNTAEPSGEEFPAFTHFWIERPSRAATELVLYALLDSESTTGAYRFTIRPGPETSVDVDMTLFPRVDLHVVGIAPLTSMFLFDETNRGRLDDYRPEVHDSDGLQITTKNGDHLWRPLANPAKLQVSTFTSETPQGFGLIQRSRHQIDFEDLDAQYERRPSAWIEPRSEWGPGAVELVEIPSGRETNDNIVAFFRPAATLSPSRPVHFAYHMGWLPMPKLPDGFGMTIATRSGASIDGRRRVFQIDFVGAGEETNGARIDVGASAGRISNVMLLPNPGIHGLRASFELDPNGADLIELRLRVVRDNRPLTETWLYQWTTS
jgi:glucans biosynthesis protein